MEVSFLFLYMSGLKLTNHYHTLCADVSPLSIEIAVYDIPYEFKEKEESIVENIKKDFLVSWREGRLKVELCK